MLAKSKSTLIALVVILICTFWWFDLNQYLSLGYIKANVDYWRSLATAEPWRMAGSYFAIYVCVTALSLPGALVLTIAGGAIFGFKWGLLLVSFASTIGATLAFLLTRFLLRDWVQQRFAQQFQTLKAGPQQGTAIHLFSLRLLPVAPFFMVNAIMGLSPIRTWTFYWVSQLGMVPGTLVYVNAGTELSKLKSPAGLTTPSLLIAFFALAALPYGSRWLLDRIKLRQLYRRFKRPSQFDYNLVVIGGGAAGLVTSFIAATLKARVALIEKHKMGGDCLNTGCVPSKALLKSAKVAHTSQFFKDYGLAGVPAQANWPAIIERIQQVIKRIEPNDSVARYSELGVDCLKGSARIRSPYEVEVDGQVVTTRSIVIATGAQPRIPDITGLDQIPFYTSDTIWSLPEQPQRLLVLGGGAMGCELAQAFSRLGSQVTVVEQAPRLLAREDEDVSMLIEKVFASEGIDVRCACRAVRFGQRQGQMELECETGDSTFELQFDSVLLALGRSPNTKALGLEEMGIETSASGTIGHDAYLRTKFPNIFVCGDVAGPYQFTHMAAHQAWYAAVNALAAPFVKYKADYRCIPFCIFADPEIARVGMNEIEAQAQDVKFEVVKYTLQELDRAIADSDDQGFVKVLVARGSDRILGATVVGARASDMITEFVTAMKMRVGLNQILRTVHVYPSYSEANKFTAGRWRAQHKPTQLLRWAESFHAWRRRQL